VNFQEAVQRTSVVREDHKHSLIESLKTIPEFSWLVGLPNQYVGRLQGDFFKEFPVIYLDRSGETLSVKKPVMVLNNSCDLPEGRSTMVSVAPVFDLEKYLRRESGKRNQQSLDSYERDIRHNRITELLYVPNLPDFPAGAIIRLDMICSVASDFLKEAVENGRRFASFTQNGFYLLLMKLTYHMTRSESMEVSRT
jgi:hypothetical protein